MPNTCPSGSLPTVGRVWALPFSHNTGNRIRLLVVLGGHVESTIPFSANPAICPWLLIAVASPLFPPIVGRALMWPFCHTNGRHVSPVPKPHKSSPFGSETSYFGKTHGDPAVVDSVPPDPTIRSSESAEVDLESVDVYHCASV